MRRSDAAEKKLLRAYEKGEWKSARPAKKTLERYRTYARATLAKDRRVNIRLPSSDVEGLQARAMEEGIPYQTLMASVLHKFIAGRLIERPSRMPASSRRRLTRAQLRAKRLAEASRKVRRESMRVHAEFAAIERDPDA